MKEIKDIIFIILFLIIALFLGSILGRLENLEKLPQQISLAIDQGFAEQEEKGNVWVPPNE